jgi:glutamyl endopeptidase
MNGAKAVATAAHCLYENGAWKSIDYVAPGKTGTTEPYGKCDALRIVVSQAWTVFEDEQWKYDYGVINLNCAIGNQIGWISYGVRSNQEGVQARIDGYPGGASGKPARTMWQAPGKSLTNLTTCGTLTTTSGLA